MTVHKVNCLVIQVLLKHTKLSILESETLLHETKMSINEMLPLVKIDPGSYDFKSDSFLS